jgi:hypothetical protein
MQSILVYTSMFCTKKFLTLVYDFTLRFFPVAKSKSWFGNSGPSVLAIKGTWSFYVFITVARLFRTFPAKVAGKFEKVLLLNKCRVKQLLQTPLEQK